MLVNIALFQHVADPADGDDGTRLAWVRFNLLAQPADVDVESFGISHEVLAPDRVDQLVARKYLASPAHQHVEELVLLRGKVRGCAAHRHVSTRVLDFDL